MMMMVMMAVAPCDLFARRTTPLPLDALCNGTGSVVNLPLPHIPLQIARV